MKLHPIFAVVVFTLPLSSALGADVDLIDQFYNDLSSNPRRMHKTAQRIVDLGRARNDRNLEARGHLRLGFLEARPHNEAANWRNDITTGIKLAGQQCTVARAEALMFGGYVKARADNLFEESLSDLNHAISLARGLNDDRLLTMAHLMVAEVLQEKGEEIALAREYVLRGLFFAEETNLESLQRMALKRVLSAYEESRLYSLAVPFATELLELVPSSDAASRLLYLAGKNPGYPAQLRDTIDKLRAESPSLHTTKARLARFEVRYGVYQWDTDPEIAAQYLDDAVSIFEEMDDDTGALRARIVRSLIQPENIDSEEAVVAFTRCFNDKQDPFVVTNNLLRTLDVASFFAKHGAWKRAAEWRGRSLGLLTSQSSQNDTSDINAARTYFDDEIDRRRLKASVKVERDAMQAERADFQKERAEFSRTKQYAWGTAAVGLLGVFLTRFFLVSRHRRQLVREVQRQTESLQKATLEAEKARDRAEQADKAKSEFLACMNHELRNPLNAILGSCQLLHHDDDTGTNHYEVIQASSEHLLQLVNNVLDVSSIEQGEVVIHNRRFDLHALCYFVQRILAHSANSKSLVFDCIIEDTVPRYVAGDDAKLRQILLNLCSNAIKFTSRGSVRVRLSSTQAGEDDSAIVTVRVLDTGPGIAADELESMFEPFRQSTEAKETRAGTGLGLYICKTFAESMGGAIHARSELNTGSEFRLVIPLKIAEGETEGGLTLEPPAKSDVQSGEVVLVVDDSQTNLSVLTSLIETMGCRAVGANGKQQAMQLFESESPSVVLLDLHMPDADGFEVLESLRRAEGGRNTRIIALTGDAIDGVRRKAFDAGFDGFLAKPVRLRHIEQLLLEGITSDQGGETV